MKSKILMIVFSLGLGIISVAHAQMKSANYWISTSVAPGAGLHAGSNNFQADVTLGQSSPVVDPINQPWSQNCELYPGFWYTIAFYDIPKRVIITPLILLLLDE